MYESFYGLDAQPFDVTPNPKFLLLTPAHREALHMLEYGVRARKGIILLLGDAGTGKTTLLRKSLAMRLADGNGAPAEYVYIKNPKLAVGELLEQLASGFKLPATAMVSKPRLLKLLEDALRASHEAGLTPALIVDEAQALSDDLIEELRLLANIESDDTKLLPLILAGQPELADRLNQHELRQFKQRIALRCQLSALTMAETATYIFGRVRLAGGDASTMFTREAVIAIHAASKGIPRLISVICDNALLTGYAMQRLKVDAAIVEEVCRDFDFAAANASPANEAQANEMPAESGSVEVAAPVSVGAG
jgi:general secretion pathway protein A